MATVDTIECNIKSLVNAMNVMSLACKGWGKNSSELINCLKLIKF